MRDRHRETIFFQFFNACSPIADRRRREPPFFWRNWRSRPAMLRGTPPKYKLSIPKKFKFDNQN
ncbi:MAG: hypothetical protein COT61_05490 [Candidatus Portnoybacteria bacterium CG09_land_8_20_14_0_10_44_13]|uniref:Uncharacterized protein n=3 Tax=Candidatus Portnoyibacteriota TaxID=1817913 RepID=A0A2H0WU44_9BACT|nr:MAG: hypothetical protein COT61_05490 [Candidatus Portnoybacteria bacterium CG09_land_8_20_14_0_10_44_13]PIZ69930.1 MAG: hypothetical protein COY11_03610 [Candidatus Portnoybacteria bacterium CG_4_10_14_0_2_um_filter_44_20]PJA63466.1 MAG: hypothetical protein CO161_00810 [Candidatus Portnoybacteria bacterium CG_4_9_14_3_um_filter_44_9]